MTQDTADRWPAPFGTISTVAFGGGLKDRVLLFGVPVSVQSYAVLTPIRFGTAPSPETAAAAATWAAGDLLIALILAATIWEAEERLENDIAPLVLGSFALAFVGAAQQTLFDAPSPALALTPVVTAVGVAVSAIYLHPPETPDPEEAIET